MKKRKKLTLLTTSALALALATPTLNPAVAEASTKVPVQQEVAIQKLAAVKTFKDVPKSHMYYDIIQEMVKDGIINGYEDGTFKPNQMISRQHAAVLVSRATNLKETVPYKAFKDIPTNHTYYEQIKELQMAGIFEADSNGRFNPTKEMTRGEMAKALAIAFDLEIPDKVTKQRFKDVPTSNKYAPYIEAIFQADVTTGYEDGTFKPITLGTHSMRLTQHGYE